MHRELRIDNFDILSLFLKVEAHYNDVSFLHTSSEGTKDHRWSLLAFDSSGSFADISSVQDVLRERFVGGESDLPFTGGLIGHVSYDTGYDLLGVDAQENDDLALPKVMFRLYEQAVLYDHLEGKIYAVGDERYVSEVLRLWESDVPQYTHEALSFRPDMDRAWYDESFTKIQQHIHEGDVYQVNLTQRFTSPFHGRSADLFARLCTAHPSPMAAYIALDDGDILSASPERFLVYEDGALSTFPIKGTMRDGPDAEKLLLSDSKEEAELNMITDLLRNDLGMVCDPGTIQIMVHRGIMHLSHIIHTYSHISGVLSQKYSAFDALLRMFPGGSITGCPKRRAMEIIDSLEPTSRGIYTGCIGYISDHGRMDMNIAIRTLLRKEDTVYLQVGGGITSDSVRDDEYQETLDKAKSFLSL